MEKRTRPKTLPAVIRRVETGCGHMFVAVSFLEDKPFEVFGILGKCGGCAKAQCESTTRTFTLALRCGVPAEQCIKQLKGIKCPNPKVDDGTLVESCSHAIGVGVEQAMIDYAEFKVFHQLASVTVIDDKDKIIVIEKGNTDEENANTGRIDRENNADKRPETDC